MTQWAQANPGLAEPTVQFDLLNQPTLRAYAEVVTATSYAYAINNLGMVVGTTYTDDPNDTGGFPKNPVYRAFVWQPELHFASIPAKTMVRLEYPGDVAGAPVQDAWSIALDINDQGDIVGGRSNTGVFPQRTGFLWLLQGGMGFSSASINTSLDLVAQSSSEGTEARTISNRGYDGTGVTALVGGRSGGLNPCPCATFLPFADPARWDLATGLANMILPLDCDISVLRETAGVMAVAPDAVQAPIQMMGGVWGKCTGNAAQCDLNDEYVPGAWTDDAIDPYPFITSVASSIQHSNGAIRSINDDLEMVGYKHFFDDDDQCQLSGILWEPSGVTPDYFQATQLLSPLGATNSTRADAINSGMVIVGSDVSANEAIRWDGPASAVDLTSRVACADCGLERISAAYDINDDGWIVGTAEFIADTELGPFQTEIGVLLVPLGDCPADVDRDGDVDATDLALVDTSVGCQPYSICWTDVNGDCVVDVEDRRIVLQSMRSNDCAQLTLGPELAAMWLSAGGNAMLSEDPTSAVAVEEAAVPESELGTFVNLMLLLDGGGEQ